MGESYGDGGADAVAAVDCDGPGMGLDDSAADGESQPLMALAASRDLSTR